MITDTPKKGRARKPYPQCKCGCGQLVETSRSIFAPGHYRGADKAAMARARSLIDPVLHSKAVSAGLKRFHKKLKAADQWDAARKKNRLALGMPDHIRAKTWTLRSPEGVIHKFSNLNEWARQNLHLFEDLKPDAKRPFFRRLARGLSQVMSGRFTSYKDWTGVDHGPQ